MSMHKQPLTPIEQDGLQKHGLAVGTPSQLSDCFRLGMAWATQQSKQLSREQVEAYMTDWLSEQDVYALEAWNEVKDAVFDSLS